ncbi:MAG: hypothetical protein GY774_15670 [Planctomycetes bacterium]|nr:hypothetical protein [Planctomycetota bacterium]
MKCGYRKDKLKQIVDKVNSENMTKADNTKSKTSSTLTLVVPYFKEINKLKCQRIPEVTMPGKPGPLRASPLISLRMCMPGVVLVILKSLESDTAHSHRSSATPEQSARALALKH